MKIRKKCSLKIGFFAVCVIATQVGKYFGGFYSLRSKELSLHDQKTTALGCYPDPKWPPSELTCLKQDFSFTELHHLIPISPICRPSTPSISTEPCCLHPSLFCYISSLSPPSYAKYLASGRVGRSCSHSCFLFFFGSTVMYINQCL